MGQTDNPARNRDVSVFVGEFPRMGNQDEYDTRVSDGNNHLSRDYGNSVFTPKKNRSDRRIVCSEIRFPSIIRIPMDAEILTPVQVR